MAASVIFVTVVTVLCFILFGLSTLNVLMTPIQYTNNSCACDFPVCTPVQKEYVEAACRNI